MKTIKFLDKLFFFKKAIQKYISIILIASFFIFVGVSIVYFNFQYKKFLILYIVGFFVILIPLFGILHTIPSSFMYYFEQYATKRYGYYTKATITNKEIEDLSYYKSVGQIGNIGYRKNWIEQYNFLIIYTYKYKKTTYKNSFYIDDKTVFNRLELEDLIPIKFLKTNPNIATVIMKNIKR